MNTVMADCSGCMFNMSGSIDPTQTDGFAFAHVAPANHAFSHEVPLQPDYPSLPSYPAHGKVTYLQNTCAVCLTLFSTNTNLEQHASSSGHTAFSCTCGAQFSRASTLTRHINSKIGLGFRCKLCDDKAFVRLDKLDDHLRRWHRLGAEAFDRYRGRNSSTGSTSPLASGAPPLQVGALGQAYHVAPGSGVGSMLNDISSATNTASDASSIESSASPGSSTAADSWLYSQPGHNTEYPS